MSQELSLFPLPLDQFKLGALAEDRKAQCLSYITRAVDPALALVNGNKNFEWKVSSSKPGVQFFKAPGAEKTQPSVKCVCTLNASFDEVMDSLITENSSQFREFETVMNEEEFLDGLVLHVLKPRQPDQPNSFSCIKWHATKCPSISTAKHRDYVYIEAVDELANERGRRVGYRLAKTIVMPDIPSLQDSHQLIRGKFYMLYTFKESENDPRKIEMCVMSLGDFRGHLPQWLITKMSEISVLRGANISKYLNLRHISNLQLARSEQLVSHRLRPNCSVCTRGFSLVRKRYNCNACGDVACHQCTAIHMVLKPGKHHFQARFCGRCINFAQKQPLSTYSEQIKNGLSKEIPTSTLPSSTLDHKTSDASSTSSTSTCDSSNNDSDSQIRNYQEGKISNTTTTNSSQLIQSDKKNSDPKLTQTAALEKSNIAYQDEKEKLAFKAKERIDELYSNSRIRGHRKTKSNLEDFSGTILNERVNMSILDLRNSIPHSAETISIQSPRVIKPQRIELRASYEEPSFIRSSSDLTQKQISISFDCLNAMEKISAAMARIDAGIKIVHENTNKFRKPEEQTKLPEEKKIELFSSTSLPTSISVTNTEKRSETIEEEQENEARNQEGFATFLRDSCYFSYEMDVELPKGWQLIYSKTTDQKYYYHEEKGITSWTLPDEECSGEGYAVL